jgi:uncharacterized membrane protein YoaK (UPF0700 family)
MVAEPASVAQAPARDPLPSLLLVMTFVTGLVDAVSYLKLGHVFVANMTGNVVFLGFGAAGAAEFSFGASLAAIVAFMGGAVIAGRLGIAMDHERSRLLAAAAVFESAMFAVAFGIWFARGDPGPGAAYALIAPLAASMGMQCVVARRLGVPDMTTTVLTLTLAGLAADSLLAGGQGAGSRRRLAAIGTMCLGAAIGAVLALRIGASGVLALGALLLLAVGWQARRSAA